MKALTFLYASMQAWQQSLSMCSCARKIRIISVRATQLTLEARQAWSALIWMARLTEALSNASFMQARLEQELLPLTKVLTDIEKRITAGDPVPDFGTLTAWAAAEAERMGGPSARKAGRRPEAAQISIKMEGNGLSHNLMSLISLKSPASGPQLLRHQAAARFLDLLLQCFQ